MSFQNILKRTTTEVIYKDAWYKVIAAFLCAHFLEVIGREESTLEILLFSYYYIDVLSGWVVAWIIIEFVSITTKLLDLHYNWSTKFIKRLIFQVLFGVVIASLFTYFLVNLQFRLVLHQRIEDTNWLIYEFPFAVLIIVLINCVYTCCYFAHQLDSIKSEAVTQALIPMREEIAFANANRIYRTIFNVRKGNLIVPLTVDQIAYIYKQEQYNYVKSFDEQRYIIDIALDELEEQLDQSIFFRANRQTIVALSSCKSYSAEGFGKLRLQLHPSADTPVIISQKRTPVFRKWINR